MTIQDIIHYYSQPVIDTQEQKTALLQIAEKDIYIYQLLFPSSYPCQSIVLDKDTLERISQNACNQKQNRPYYSERNRKQNSAIQEIKTNKQKSVSDVSNIQDYKIVQCQSIKKNSNCNSWTKSLSNAVESLQKAINQNQQNNVKTPNFDRTKKPHVNLRNKKLFCTIQNQNFMQNSPTDREQYVGEPLLYSKQLWHKQQLTVSLNLNNKVQKKASLRMTINNQTLNQCLQRFSNIIDFLQ